MVESNVRKELSMKIDVDAGPRKWRREDLYHKTNNPDGYVPNPGDVLLGEFNARGEEETLTSVNYKTGEWATLSETVAQLEESRRQADIYGSREALNHVDPATLPPDSFPPEEHKPDAGTLAREKVERRSLAAKAGGVIRWTVMWCLFLAFVAIALIAWYGKYTMVTGRLTDERMCSAKLSEEDAVTGRRTFNYSYREVFGLRIIDTKTITERTEVDIRGQAMTIVGLVGEEPIEDVAMSNNTIEGKVQERGAKHPTGALWWAVDIQMGEKGIQYLKHADTYTFVVDNKVAVVEYASFCR